jgi:hypothetical protein
MDPLQLAIPLAEVVALVQQGLISLALDAFTQLAEQMMQWDVDGLVGPKTQANADRAAPDRHPPGKLSEGEPS